MEIILHEQVKGLRGTIAIPGDKSISHRAVMLGALAKGTTTITNFLAGEDCLSTIDCFKKMGVEIEQNDEVVVVTGAGHNGLKEPAEILDVGNSGTTTRLMLGILASQPFHSVVIGDESIAKRPMDRVTVPLKQMGAEIDGRSGGSLTPISIRGGNLEAINYVSPVASAQVKSSILLAGLGADGTTSVTEPHLSRDHTERMLQAFGAEVTRNGLTASVSGGQELKATDVHVPGDISSAAFFLAAGAMMPDSELTLKNVGMNPTRTGMIDVLKAMNADLTIHNERIVNEEPVADLTVRSSQLQAMQIDGALIPRLIDEIPIIALLASQATGTTVIKDAEELKVKETNRIDTVVEQLQKLGVEIEAKNDGMVIYGKSSLHGGEVDSCGDHRIGMMLAIASCLTAEQVTIRQAEAVRVSYPAFFDDLETCRTK